MHLTGLHKQRVSLAEKQAFAGIRLGKQGRKAPVPA
jgi:hypothetical protein